MQNEVMITDNIEKITRFQSLQPGQYWKALQCIENQEIDKDTVLLIESIRYIDDIAHTIILRPHPSKMREGLNSRISEHRFLLQDFLTLFMFEPDHQTIRNEEIRAVQKRINLLQSELIEAQTNPDILNKVIESKLKKKNMSAPESLLTCANSIEQVTSISNHSLLSVIEAGITEQSIQSLKEAADTEHKVATIKSEWIQNKITTIASTIKELTPFYKEQAAAALAQTEDVRLYITKLLEGIESLDLYIGKEVSVIPIKEGEPAAPEIPLTFVQKKLLMDEELAVYLDLDEWFDFNNQALFFKAIKEHPGLVDQIFPTQRCILVMATTRRYIDYGDSFENSINNDRNKLVFLLVRNGENVYQVCSPVESHLRAERLFPSKDEQERIFKGIDGSQIKFEDINYTDKVAMHENFALHYKRFLILVCGLDHRLKLFGKFYEGEQSLKFVSIKFQEKYCQFLHDDDGAGLLPKEQRMPLMDWINNKNAYLQSGSRVLCNCDAVMNPDTAPAACKNSRGSYEFFDRNYRSFKDFCVAIAYQDKQSICVDIAVKGYSYNSGRDREFNCKVNLSKLGSSWSSECQPYLCLDAVNPEDLFWYIHNRDCRENHLSYIQFFKTALKHIQHELKTENDTREYLYSVLADANLSSGDNAKDLVSQAIIAWRAKNRGRALPSIESDKSSTEWRELLDQMYMLVYADTNQVLKVKEFIKYLGYEPLRVAISGKAQLIAYAAPTIDECDNRLESHRWVHRFVISNGKTKLGIKSRSWALLPDNIASEITVHNFDGSKSWVGLKSIFSSYNNKQKLFNITENFLTELSPFLKPMDHNTYKEILNEWISLRSRMLESAKKYVNNPLLTIPLGIYYDSIDKQLKFICLSSSKPHVLLYELAPIELKDEFIREFVSVYENKNARTNKFMSEIKEGSQWELVSVDVFNQQSYGAFLSSNSKYSLSGKHTYDPRLSLWLNNWIHKNKSNFCVIDEVENSKGKILDRLLNITLPPGTMPVEIQQVRAQGEKFTGWLDLYPNEMKLTHQIDNKHRHTYYCRVIECKSIESGYNEVSKIEKEFKLISAKELVDLPQPPDGIERWYMFLK